METELIGTGPRKFSSESPHFGFSFRISGVSVSLLIQDNGVVHLGSVRLSDNGPVDDVFGCHSSQIHLPIREPPMCSTPHRTSLVSVLSCTVTLGLHRVERPTLSETTQTYPPVSHKTSPLPNIISSFIPGLLIRKMLVRFLNGEDFPSLLRSPLLCLRSDINSS